MVVGLLLDECAALLHHLDHSLITVREHILAQKCLTSLRSEQAAVIYRAQKLEIVLEASLYVCMYVCMCVCIYIGIVYRLRSSRLYLRPVCMYVCMCMCMYVGIVYRAQKLEIVLETSLYVCMYVYIQYTYIFVSTHKHTHTRTYLVIFCSVARGRVHKACSTLCGDIVASNHYG